jgi:hypothetical protein
MKQIYPDLWQTTVEHPFHGVNTHAYLFVQKAGNILFYSSGIREEYSQIKALGGIAYQYLSHRDEVGPALSEIKELFGSKLCCHVLEEPAVRKETIRDLRVTYLYHGHWVVAPCSKNIFKNLKLFFYACPTIGVHPFPSPQIQNVRGR